ncbi:MAG: hypothetical protein AB1644_11920 [Candidatus Zixiibacteriota bacterium]
MKRFEQETLNPLKAVNDSTQLLLVEIENCLELPENQRAELFRGLLPRIGQLKERFTGLGNDVMTFSTESSKCGGAPNGMADAIEQNGTLESSGQGAMTK